LTPQGLSHLPNNYQHLALNLIQQMSQNLSDNQINVIIEGMVDSMVDEAQCANGSMRERLDSVVAYMSEHGYEAQWEVQDGGYILHASNCPYHDIAHETDMLCKMDMRLIAKLLGVVPRMTSHRSTGGETCSYFIPSQS
jgi:predicted ArsR family transcriptional regulator